MVFTGLISTISKAIMPRTPSHSPNLEVIEPASTHSPDLEVVSPTRPIRPVLTTTTTRGRPQKRLTSSKRVSAKTAGSKQRSPRKPLMPTTKTAMAKERKHRRYVKKRAAEAEVERVLRRPETYWRVLRNGKQYRSFGGTRVR